MIKFNDDIRWRVPYRLPQPRANGNGNGHRPHRHEKDRTLLFRPARFYYALLFIWITGHLGRMLEEGKVYDIMALLFILALPLYWKRMRNARP